MSEPTDKSSASNGHTPTNPEKEHEEAQGQVFFDAENSEQEGSLPSLPASPDPQQAQRQSTDAHNHESVHSRSNANDPDSVLLATLRLQIADLTSQVTSLNGKLVNAYSRIGDLEDDLDRSEGRGEYLRKRTAALEQERKQWEERVERGLLVEKAHVQTELSRMMDRVTEEAASRGKAERERANFESELEDLSASLFNEANRMVAVERKAKLIAEGKLAQFEEHLQDTETIIRQQAKQMRDLGGKLESAEAERDAARQELTKLQAQHQLKTISIDQGDNDTPPDSATTAVPPGHGDIGQQSTAEDDPSSPK